MMSILDLAGCDTATNIDSLVHLHGGVLPTGICWSWCKDGIGDPLMCPAGTLFMARRGVVVADPPGQECLHLQFVVCGGWSPELP
jgi:hypothetical protein